MFDWDLNTPLIGKELQALQIPCNEFHTPHHNLITSPLLTHQFSSALAGVKENFPTLEIRQGNLKLTTFPHSVDNTRNKKMIS